MTSTNRSFGNNHASSSTRSAAAAAEPLAAADCSFLSVNDMTFTTEDEIEQNRSTQHPQLLISSLMESQPPEISAQTSTATRHTQHKSLRQHIPKTQRPLQTAKQGTNHGHSQAPKKHSHTKPAVGKVSQETNLTNPHISQQHLNYEGNGFLLATQDDQGNASFALSAKSNTYLPRRKPSPPAILESSFLDMSFQGPSLVIEDNEHQTNPTPLAVSAVLGNNQTRSMDMSSFNFTFDQHFDPPKPSIQPSFKQDSVHMLQVPPNHKDLEKSLPIPSTPRRSRMVKEERRLDSGVPSLLRPQHSKGPQELRAAPPMARLNEPLPPAPEPQLAASTPAFAYFLENWRTWNWWEMASWVLTFYLCECVFVKFGKHNINTRQAFREKLASCVIIAILMILVAFFTYGMQSAFCPSNGTYDPSQGALNQSDHKTLAYRETVVIFGNLYNFNETSKVLAQAAGVTLSPDWYGADISGLFQPPVDYCSGYPNLPPKRCAVQNQFGGILSSGNGNCLSVSVLDGLHSSSRNFFTWEDIASNSQPPNTLTVFNGMVLNLTNYLNLPMTSRIGFSDSETEDIIVASIGVDATRIFVENYSSFTAVRCLQQRYMVGYVDRVTIGCNAVQFVQSVILAVILCLILTRFFMAIAFHWFLAERITKPRKSIPKLRHAASPAVGSMSVTCSYRLTPGSACFPQLLSNGDSNPSYSLWTKPPGSRPPSEEDPFCIFLVTCYSETQEGIEGTVKSLASTNYPDTHKLIFVVADGIITGKGNAISTPQAVLNLVSVHPLLEGRAEPKNYFAIADGSKTHNRAQVHAGFYDFDNRRVPMIAVIKCGTEAEISEKKPGNRGKRDSQMLLMKFLKSVMLENGAMTELDHDLAKKVMVISGVTPDAFELVLMVDADTTVQSDSLQYMVLAMQNDESIMGLCGETRIENKRDSWVTKIQVFEYYISHHLGKAFESVFGGVTCLPGCFCMYRVKGRNKDNHSSNWLVPILVNEHIISEYSVSQVDTLHKKNLLCLGEDRFLTTLMLQTFSKRKMVFVPQAICHTTVPNDFATLLSQRRRWINSTIHNLLELVLVKNLCGIFCFSMQFVVALELIGTVILPAALLFMVILILSAIFTGIVSTIPLLTLLATLGSPSILIAITTRELAFIGWMFVYLLALPIWNFVLPLYAFWHLDDVSWGETRRVEGEVAQRDHSDKDGDYEVGAVTVKTFANWELEKSSYLPIEDSFDAGYVLRTIDSTEEKVLALTSSVQITKRPTIPAVYHARVQKNKDKPSQPNEDDFPGNLTNLGMKSYSAKVEKSSCNANEVSDRQCDDFFLSPDNPAKDFLLAELNASADSMSFISAFGDANRKDQESSAECIRRHSISRNTSVVGFTEYTQLPKHRPHVARPVHSNFVAAEYDVVNDSFSAERPSLDGTHIGNSRIIGPPEQRSHGSPSLGVIHYNYEVGSTTVTNKTGKPPTGVPSFEQFNKSLKQCPQAAPSPRNSTVKARINGPRKSPF